MDGQPKTDEELYAAAADTVNPEVYCGPEEAKDEEEEKADSALLENITKKGKNSVS